MDSLPIEMVEVISSHLTVQELAACCAVSHGWRDVFNQDLLWGHHCDRPLEEYLRTTPAVVEPVFVSPESESSTLSPVCQWRLAFMRENLLWNNWRTGNYKSQVIKTKGVTRCNHPLQFGFLTNDYLVILYSNKIELWDVTKEEASKVSETFESFKSHCKFMIVGNSNEIFLLVNEFHVQVFGMDANRQIVMRCMFFFDQAAKIPSDKLDSDKNMLEQEIIDCSKILCYGVVGVIFVLIMEQNFHVWDLETGQKLKSEQCPLDMPHSILTAFYSKTGNYIVVAATPTKACKPFGIHERRTVFYFVYSTTSLAFLPFTKQSVDSYKFGSYCCIYERFLGISDMRGIRVYNVESSILLYQVTGLRYTQLPIKLEVVNYNFVFNHDVDNTIKMFHALNKTIKSLPKKRDFESIGGKFLAIGGDPDEISGVWELGDFFKLTKIKPSCLFKLNLACSRLVDEVVIHVNLFEEDPFTDAISEDEEHILNVNSYLYQQLMEDELDISIKHFW